jgi:chorismate mutase
MAKKTVLEQEIEKIDREIETLQAMRQRLVDSIAAKKTKRSEAPLLDA